MFFVTLVFLIRLLTLLMTYQKSLISGELWMHFTVWKNQLKIEDVIGQEKSKDLE